MTRRLLISIVLLVCVASCSAPEAVVNEDPRISQGRAMVDRGQYEAAETLFKELLREAERDSDGLLQAQCRKWLGNVRLAYRRDADALVLYQQARAQLDSLLSAAGARTPRLVREERANVLNNIAVVEKNAGRYNEAEVMHRLVLADDRHRGEPLPIAVSLYNIGTVYYLRADAARRGADTARFRANLDTARAYFRESLAVFPTADAWLNLGNTFAHEGRRDSAVTAFRRANDEYRASGFRVHEAMCLGNIGLMLDEDGRGEDAAEALRRGIAIIEELRGGLTSIDVRSSFVSNKYHLYERLISILVRLGKFDEAFEYAERAKARSFLDMLGNKTIGEKKQRTARGAALVAEERALHDQISRLIDTPDSSARVAILLQRHRSVLDTLRDVDPEYASVKSIEPAPARDLRALLDDSTALVEYFIGETVDDGERAAFVFLLRRDTLVAKRLTIRAEYGLERRIETLRRRLYADFPNARAAALRAARLQKGLTMDQALAEWRAGATDSRWQFELMEMYSVLLAPVDALLRGVRQAYVVPHGPLHHLPFQALVRIGNFDKRRDVHVARPRFLIEDMAIAYLPSASVLAFVRSKAPADGATSLVVGDPAYADPVYRARPLAGALVEADSVARYIDGAVVLTGAAAEEARVKREAVRADVLHFATHGELNKREPLRSRILLAAAKPEGDDDGNLTVGEVFNLDLHAALVALSACQTAQVAGEEGGFTQGDELVGLTRSFVYAGTPSVIASLWVVDDAATLAWMIEFYRAWRRDGMAKAQAARLAALSLLNTPKDPDWVFPYYWSAFIFFGDTR